MIDFLRGAHIVLFRGKVDDVTPNQVLPSKMYAIDAMCTQPGPELCLCHRLILAQLACAVHRLRGDVLRWHRLLLGLMHSHSTNSVLYHARSDAWAIPVRNWISTSDGAGRLPMPQGQNGPQSYCLCHFGLGSPEAGRPMKQNRPFIISNIASFRITCVISSNLLLFV